MSSPGLDVITSSQELRWLLQSSVWTQPESSWQTLASCVPLEESITRPAPAPVPGCCHTRLQHNGATDRTKTKVTGRLDDNKVGGVCVCVGVGVVLWVLFVKIQSCGGAKRRYRGAAR